MHLQEVRVEGITQTVHVMVTTYGEAAEMIRECVIRLLAAPEPVYMEKFIYVCDDGHAKPEGPKKRRVVDELRILGALFPWHRYLFVYVHMSKFCSEHVRHRT
jgi:hypothetical protein